MTEVAFPVLREDLSLYPGAPTPAGHPVWIIHDPVRNRFFQIEWSVFEVLSRWGVGDFKKIATLVNRETVLQISEDFVARVAQFLKSQQLVRVSGSKAMEGLANAANEKQQSRVKWLIHHYLFFRVPVVRPDHFLTATLPFVNWLYSKAVLLVLIISLLLGMILVSRQWDVFITSMVDMFSAQGLLYFVFALLFAKISHELGHAYTAKKYGCKVPVMGVAFLVLWPMLYTDTNDTWKLASRRQRLAVAAAGMSVELAIATLATLLWSFLPPGNPRDMMFVLATTTWVSSLLINLSPFMRFDGYYLMSDWMNIPNLHARAFKLARWRLREILFNLGEPAPEHFPPARARFLICFAFAVWIYRLVLFLGIAVVVYHFFIKVVGILLFVIEVSWFIARPIKEELGEWMKRRRTITRRLRSWVTLMLASCIIALGIIPWQNKITAQALLEADNHQTLYARSAGQLISSHNKNRLRVNEGEPLFIFENPDLKAQLEAFIPQQKVLNALLKSASFDQAVRDRKDTILADLVRLQAKKQNLQKEISLLTVLSPLKGVLVDVDPGLTEGQWVQKGQRLAAVRSEIGASIVSYINEDDVFRIEAGSPCHFSMRTSGRRYGPCFVESIENASADQIMEPVFASVFGGSIPVRATDRAMVPERAVYKVRMTIADTALKVSSQVVGYVTIEGEQESFFERIWKWGASVVIRESGL